MSSALRTALRDMVDGLKTAFDDPDAWIVVAIFISFVAAVAASW